MRHLPPLSDFCDFIQNVEGTIILVMHDQADPDAVGSAIALTCFLNQLNSSVSVRTLQPDISLLGQKLLEQTSFQFNSIEIDQIESPALYILLDTNQIESLRISPEIPVAIFDHHIQTEKIREVEYDFHLDTFRATSEIITSLYSQMNFPVNLMAAQALLAGLIFDTRRFLYADQHLFDCVNYLLRDNPDAYSQIIPLFTFSPTYSEKIACIKAAQRMKRYQIGDQILLLSHVSSFEAAAARSLIFLGGDVAIVIANQKDNTRISMRTTPNFVTETGISLGKNIIPALITKFGGTGGGHDGAAGYNNPESLEIADLKAFLFHLFKEGSHD